MNILNLTTFSTLIHQNWQNTKTGRTTKLAEQQNWQYTKTGRTTKQLEKRLNVNLKLGLITSRVKMYINVINRVIPCKRNTINMQQFIIIIIIIIITFIRTTREPVQSIIHQTAL
jgi:hypothetical protein